VLRIDRATYDAIVAHAREDHPDEACGVVAGPEGSDRPERFIPMLNAARSPTFYEFDSGDLLRLYRDMDDRDEEPVVIYHSHTATEAYPSRTDISYASEPNAHYVLVSTRSHGEQTGLAGDEVEFRSFRIVDGAVTEEDVEVVESYLFGHSPTTPRRSQARGGTLQGAAGAEPGMPHVERAFPVQTHVRCAPAQARPLNPRRTHTPWPSRSGSRPSCAPTPAATRPSRAAGTPWPRSSTTSTPSTRA
jgi:proteasome lid subunit RPN8/RPN11